MMGESGLSYESLLAGLLLGVAGSYLLRMRPALARSLAGHGSMKLVLVVRMDLGMSRGKVASQCAHAAVSCYQQAVAAAPHNVKLWQMMGQPKVVLKPDKDGDRFLIELCNKAKSAGLVTSLIRDAGKTQVDCGSVTVLGIGPGKTTLIDQFTGQLKLL